MGGEGYVDRYYGTCGLYFWSGCCISDSNSEHAAASACDSDSYSYTNTNVNSNIHIWAVICNHQYACSYRNPVVLECIDIYIRSCCRTNANYKDSADAVTACSLVISIHYFLNDHSHTCANIHAGIFRQLSYQNHVDITGAMDSLHKRHLDICRTTWP